MRKAAAAFLLVTGCAGGTEDRISSSALPSIFGADDRRDVFDVTEEPWQTIARRSVASLLRTEHWSLCDGAAAPRSDAPTAQEWHDLCPEVRFADQPIVSRCSATLIDRDLIVTAGHCIVDEAQCRETVFAFGLFYQADGELRDLEAADVYRCSEIVARPGDKDIAIVRTDRPVADAYAPVPFAADVVEADTPVAVIGFPSYVPMKVSDGCTVRSRFGDLARLDCDVLRGSSGSGVFSEAGELLGVLILVTGDYRPAGDCRVPVGYTQDGMLIDAGSSAPLFVQSIDARIGLDQLCASDVATALCERPAVCGDGACSGGETSATCATDCPQPQCGDGHCEMESEPTSCPSDCALLGCSGPDTDAGAIGGADASVDPGDDDPVACGCRASGRDGGWWFWLVLLIDRLRAVRVWRRHEKSPPDRRAGDHRMLG